MVSIEAAIDRFLTHLAGERRASAHTVDAYRRDLLNLLAFVRDKGSIATLADIDVFVLRPWLGNMARRVSTATLARRMAAVRSFFRYFVTRGDLAKNPADDLSTPKMRRPLPTFLGVDAAAEVMRAPALETAPQEDVDPGMPVHRVVLLVIGDAPGDLPGGLHHQQR